MPPLRTCGDMKLNGKIYINKKQVELELEELLLDVELRNFIEVSSDLEDLDSNEIDDVLKLLNDFKMDIDKIFYSTKYYSVSDLTHEIEELKFNPKIYDVALHKFGAYGIKTKAGTEEIKRYAFNVSLASLIKRIQKYNNS